MRDVVVTGPTSYLGICLSRALSAERRVVPIVRSTSDASRLRALAPGVDITPCDTDDVDAIAALLAGLDDPTIVHLAGWYRRSHEPADIAGLIDANLAYGVRLCDAMRLTGVRRLVTTGSFFQHLDSAAYRPVNLYAALKEAFERILDFYVDAGFMSTVILLLADVYGPGDWRRKFIDVVAATQRPGAPAQLGLPTSDVGMQMVHVDDVVAAYERAIEGLESGEFSGSERFAVRTPDPTSLSGIVDAAERVGGRTVERRWGEYPDVDRTISAPWDGPTLPGWATAVDLDTGLADLIHDTTSS